MKKDIRKRIVKELLRAAQFIVYRTKIIFTDPSFCKRSLDEPSILICNHKFFPDGALVLNVFRKSTVYSIVAEKMFEQKFAGWGLKYIDCIRIERNMVDTGWLRKAVDVIRSGGSIEIFPEGHENKDGVMSEFKSGFILLAMQTGAPIIPMYISEKYRAFGKRQKIYVGSPVKIDIKEMSVDFVKEKTRELEQKVHELAAIANRQLT